MAAGEPRVLMVLLTAMANSKYPINVVEVVVPVPPGTVQSTPWEASIMYTVLAGAA